MLFYELVSPLSVDKPVGPIEFTSKSPIWAGNNVGLMLQCFERNFRCFTFVNMLHIKHVTYYCLANVFFYLTTIRLFRQWSLTDEDGYWLLADSLDDCCSCGHFQQCWILYDLLGYCACVVISYGVSILRST